MDWWKASNTDGGSRLIFVLDTNYSYQWIQDIKRFRQHYVAIQTWQRRQFSDPELASDVKMGSFTAEWVDYSCKNNFKIDWQSSDRSVRALYGVSKSWTDFRFHSPTHVDMSRYWENNFPKPTRLLIRLTSLHEFCNICSCSDCILHCIKRKKMAWLPPLEYDSGHGFKFVRSTLKWDVKSATVQHCM